MYEIMGEPNTTAVNSSKADNVEAIDSDHVRSSLEDEWSLAQHELNRGGGYCCAAYLSLTFCWKMIV